MLLTIDDLKRDAADISACSDDLLQQYRTNLEELRVFATAFLTRVNREIDRRDVARHNALQAQVRMLESGSAHAVGSGVTVNG